MAMLEGDHSAHTKVDQQQSNERTNNENKQLKTHTNKRTKQQNEPWTVHQNPFHSAPQTAGQPSSVQTVVAIEMVQIVVVVVVVRFECSENESQENHVDACVQAQNPSRCPLSLLAQVSVFPTANFELDR